MGYESVPVLINHCTMHLTDTLCPVHSVRAFRRCSHKLDFTESN